MVEDEEIQRREVGDVHLPQFGEPHFTRCDEWTYVSEDVASLADDKCAPSIEVGAPDEFHVGGRPSNRSSPGSVDVGGRDDVRVDVARDGGLEDSDDEASTLMTCIRKPNSIKLTEDQIDQVACLSDP